MPAVKRELTEEDYEIYRLHAVNRWTQARIAERYGMSQQSLSRRLMDIRASLPPIDFDELRRDMLSIYENTLERVAHLIELPGVPVTAGKDGEIVCDPTTGEVVRDYGGRLAALKVAHDATMHIRKMFGLDAPERMSHDGGVRIEVVGVELDNLS